MRKCMVELFRSSPHRIRAASRSQFFCYSASARFARLLELNSKKLPQVKNSAENSSFSSLFNEITEILGAESSSPTLETSSINAASIAQEARLKKLVEKEEVALCAEPVCEKALLEECPSVSVSDVSPIVHEITAIVRAESGCVPMEERLEGSGLAFDADIAGKVLKRCFKVPHLALRFFNWIKLRDDFSLTTEMYNTMLYIAGEAKQFQVVQKLMEEMEASSCEVNLKTYTIIIAHYGKAKLFGSALLVFEKMKQFGFEADYAVYSIMVRTLCIAHKADIAIEFYKEMVLKDMTPSLGLYKMLLNCLAISGDVNAVHSVSDDMVRKFQIPETVVYGLVLKSFCISGAITDALQMIRSIKNRGLSVGHVHFQTLVKGFCKAGKVEDALEIVDIMKRKNLMDSNIYDMIIDGYLLKNDISRALDMFQEIKDSGHLPSISTYTALLQTLLKSKEFKKGGELFDEMLDKEIELDSVAFMAIVVGYVSGGSLSKAWRTLKVMEEKGIKPNEKFYAVFVNELCKKGRNYDIIKVLNEMKASKVVIADEMIKRVISHLEKKGEMEILKEVQQLQRARMLSFRNPVEPHTLREEETITEVNFTQPGLTSPGSDPEKSPSMGFDDDVKEVSKILSSSFHWSMIQEALVKLSIKFTPEFVLAILHNCKIHGQTALNFFNWVSKQQDYNHTTETYNMAIKIAGCGKSFKHMKSLFCEMKRNGIMITPHTWTIMIMLYGRIGLTDIAMSLFDEMKSSECQPTSSSYKFLIVSLCGRKGRNVDRAVKLFHEMVNGGHIPDKELIEVYLGCLCETDRLEDARNCVSYLSKVRFTMELRYSMYIRALCRNGKLEEAQQIMNKIGAKHEKLNGYVYGSIVHGLLQRGQLEDAVHKVEEMKRAGITPTVHVYTSLIIHFFKEKQIRKVLEILEKMQMEGCEPTIVTYSAIIRGYMNVGKVDEACNVFSNMRSNGPFPDFRTYSMFISCLCKAGRSEEAMEVISEMFTRGIVPSSINFRTVFFGLNREGKRELARDLLGQKKALARRRQFAS